MTMQETSFSNNNMDDGNTEYRLLEQKQNSSPAVSESKLQVAATYILDAMHGNNLPFGHKRKYLKYYELYNKWYLVYLLYFTLILLLALAIFEEPAAESFALPVWTTMSMELFCLSYFIFRLGHSKLCLTRSTRWKNIKTDVKFITIAALILITLLDMAIYLTVTSTGRHWWRFVRVLRPVFLVSFKEAKDLRELFINIKASLPGIMRVLALLFLVVGLFALLAREIFYSEQLKNPDGTDYMSDYFENLWNLYVLVTTSNSPDIMMPAYDASSWYMLFFIPFVILCVFIFMSIFLAVIYKDYKSNLEINVKKINDALKQKLENAWKQVARIPKGGTSVVTMDTWKKLMTYVAPRKGPDELAMIWEVLTPKDKNNIEKSDFMNLTDILKIPVINTSRFTPFMQNHFPDIFNCKVSMFMRKCILHRYFRGFLDVMIVANALLIGFRFNLLEPFFLALFSTECILRIYALGLYRYFTKPWDLFDFIVIFLAVFFTLIEVLTDQNEKQAYFYVILVLRVLRLVRILNNFKEFHVIMSTLMSIGPSILSFSGVIMVIFYVYAIIGLETFAGKISYYGYPSEEDNSTFNESQLFCGNPKLEGSVFYRDRYCNNNFNTIIKAFVTLFELTMVNQWHIITIGYVAVTNKAAVFYFLSFHFTMVITIFNIFIGLILDLFIMESEFAENPLGSEIETRIEHLGLAFQSLHSSRESSIAPDVESDYGIKPVRADSYRFKLGSGIISASNLHRKLFLMKQTLEEDTPIANGNKTENTAAVIQT